MIDAWNEGYEAYAPYAHEDNPYVQGTNEYHNWNDGWLVACGDDALIQALRVKFYEANGWNLAA